MRAKLRDVAEAATTDPKQALMDSLGDIAGIEVFHNLVLTATYITPPKIMKGPNGEEIVFHRTDRSYAEDRFQGKAHLVLKVGPLAFEDDKIVKFGGVKLQPGDWVVARPSDGLELFSVDHTKSAGTTCHLFEDAVIKGRISDPSMIY